MIKITLIGVSSDNRSIYINPCCVESYDPIESELHFNDGRVILIDPSKSDVHALTDGYHVEDKAELDYLRKVIAGIGDIIGGGVCEKPVLSGPVPNGVVDMCESVMDELAERYSKKKDDK